ncbi:integrase family protein [Mesorhizobium sp. B2-8-9]|uniref:tyrosine-type recombinase/integrase n=1 Tax=Mesorhizobium sp. B2-8-9 TaxID=2589899 RepID=UPI001125BF30|nr:integrase family protein [Mesorhizobium sp. B2-8-9]TPI78480.1 integrase family protein [Mesorhizobium sp. B2-8-9]
MTDLRLALTDRVIENLQPASSGQYFARDTDLPGFMVLVGKRRKTFVVQGERRKAGKRLSVRMKVAEVGELTTRAARAKAKDILGKIASGVDPRPSRKPDGDAVAPDLPSIANPTLRIAWERYRDGHMKNKGRSDGTINNYRDHIERLLADWLDEPLSKLGNDPSLVTVRHEKLTKENGAYIANGCMRTLRAVYNHARKAARTLPADNPVSAIDWNAEHRRNSALGLSDIEEWFTQLAALKNPVRRELHLFMLLSGHRPEAIRKARVEHVDFHARVLHIPRPKGGEVKAFDIPLSNAMIRCLVRVMRIGRALYGGQSREWLFPADSESGHIMEHKEKRSDLSKWGNDLRQTFRTIAQAAGVAELDVHLLMNHSVPGVNAGYITRNKLLSDHLRQQQEAISRRILEGDRSRQKEAKRQTRIWPELPSRRVLSVLITGMD